MQNPIDFFKSLFKIKKHIPTGTEPIALSYLHPEKGAINTGYYCTTGDLMGTKKYKILATQTSTNAPIVTVLMNTISDTTPVWTYSTTGVFLLTSANSFPASKTIPLSELFLDTIGNKYKLEWIDINTMRLTTYSYLDTTIPANGILTNQFINIEIIL